MQQNREKVVIRTSIVGIAANVVLVIFKALIGFIAASVALISDALNNLTDALSSIITIIGTKLSNKKPDRKHPFGHGRIEYITASIIAFLILAAGIIAIYESIVSIVDHFQNGTMPSHNIFSIIVISAAIVVKVFVTILYRIKGKQVKSSVLCASGTDAMFDAILSAGTLVGIIIAMVFNFYVEGYIGVIIGAFIIKSGIEVLVEAISQIIGQRFDKEQVDKIMADINSVPGVRGAYDLILNSYGENKLIGSVHVGVDATISAVEIQTIERTITHMMFAKYNTIMTVGIYVEDVNDEETKKVHSTLVDIISQYPTVLQLHGFFLNKEKHICNFDLVISFDENEPQARADEIKEKIKEAYPEYDFIVFIDHDYSLT